MDSKQEIGLKRTLNFIICFILICTSGVVQFAFIWNSQSIVAVFCFSCIAFIFCGNFVVSRQKTYKLLILYAIVLLNILVYSDNVDGHIALMLIIGSAFLLSYLINWNLFTQFYINIMFVICLISLICFGLYLLYPVYIINTVPLVSYWSLNSHYALIYNFPGNQYVIRNFGPYHEGGMFAIYIALAVLFLFENKTIETRWGKLQVVIFLVTLISTFSTTGLLLLGIIFIGKIGPCMFSLKVNIKVIFFLLIGIVFFVWEENTYHIIGNKFSIDNTSYIARSIEWEILFEQFGNYFLAGMGYQNNSLIRQYGLVDGTNGLVSVLLQFGGISGLCILGLYMHGLASFPPKFRDKILYIVFAFICFASEPTIFQPLFMCMLFGKTVKGSIGNVFEGEYAD